MAVPPLLLVKVAVPPKRSAQVPLKWQVDAACADTHEVAKAAARLTARMINDTDKIPRDIAATRRSPVPIVPPAP
jgi:hypothetical protein